MGFSFPDILTELVAILLATAVLGYLAVLLRQPLIVAVIAAGVIVGPSGLNWVRSADQIHLLAQIGLAVLLFAVGLRLDLNLIRTLGPVALATGLGQIVLTTIGGYGIAMALGMEPVTALYVSVSLTFSSTIIIVKLLSDKKDLESLHGRIALGVLIVQDLVVILAMIALSALVGDKPGSQAMKILGVLARGVALIGGAGIVSWLVLPRVLHRLASSVEMFVLASLVWALALYGASRELGFSGEVGAFIAGVLMASTHYRDFLAARLATLRDFLVLFFFIELGTRLDFASIGPQVYSAIPLSIFVLIVKPLLVMIITGVMGYRKRTSCLAGISIAQISEFSLILIAMGAELGHIGRDAVGVVTLVGLVTIGASTYMILHSNQIYDKLSPFLSILERKKPIREPRGTESQIPETKPDIILFGLGRYGGVMAEELVSRGRNVLGVDFDPQTVKAWRAQGLPIVFGDAEDPEFLSTLPLAEAKWVVSSIRDINTSRALKAGLAQIGSKCNLAFAASGAVEVDSLRDMGADIVFAPLEDAATQAVDLLIMKEEQIVRQKMDRFIEELSDHYIICGFGRMGQQIAKDLRAAGVPFVVVESNPEQLPRLMEQEIPHVVGEASEDEVLLRAGIKRAKGLISVEPTDEDNVFVVLTARVLNPKLFIVARSILVENEAKLQRAGADRVMSPYILGGRRMAAAVTQPDALDLMDLLLHTAQVDVGLGRAQVAAGGPADGRSLGEIDLWRNCGVTVLAVKRDGQLLANPSPDCTLNGGDELIMMGSKQQLEAASETVGG
ncbi:MAG: cation:proton antiporter [Armatimonadetes bacterium]|nr:cation:proton antiporter [Armatimonadota bacterium]